MRPTRRRNASFDVSTSSAGAPGRTASSPIPTIAPPPTVQSPPRQPAPPQQPMSGTIVVTTGKEASAAVVRLVELSTEQAERQVEEATEDANRIREEANRTAHQLTTDARTRAERVQSEARVNAERLKAEVLGRAEKLDREIASRRGEMFGDLEKQRDDLTAAVGALRDFEAAYRANLTSHLRKQIETLESSSAEPVEVPDVVHDQRPAEHSSNGTGEQGGGDPTGGSSSNTPRLDALRGDQR